METVMLQKDRLFRRGCPICGSRRRYPLRRPRNWRFSPVGKVYCCTRCNSHYMQVVKLFCVLVEAGFTPSQDATH
jgi:hypothetical protein